MSLLIFRKKSNNKKKLTIRSLKLIKMLYWSFNKENKNREIKMKKQQYT